MERIFVNGKEIKNYTKENVDKDIVRVHHNGKYMDFKKVPKDKSIIFGTEHDWIECIEGNSWKVEET